MKNNITQFLAILFLVVLASGCEKFFTTTLTIDPPPHSDQLVIHAFLSDNDSLLPCSVTKSFALLDNITEDQYQDSATVTLFRDGVKVGDLESLDDTFRPFNYGYFNQGAIGSNGVEFEIKVVHPTLGEASAKSTMPNLVPIKEIEYKKDVRSGDFGDREDAVEITFDDPLGVENYYEFALIQADTFGSGEVFINDLFTSFNDPNISEGVKFNYYLLSDESFDGKEYKFRLFGNDFSSGAIFVLWRSVSKSTYLYSKSVSDQLDAQDLGTFADPVSIFSNVENGLGVFGLKAERLYPLER